MCKEQTFETNYDEASDCIFTPPLRVEDKVHRGSVHTENVESVPRDSSNRDHDFPPADPDWD